MKINVTLQVKSGEAVSKATLYSWFGIVAESIAENGSFEITDVVITGDEPSPPPVVAKVRKPRGPNKPKLQAVSAATTQEAPQQLDIEHEMPDFLRRSA
jgi:hypothetical protein